MSELIALAKRVEALAGPNQEVGREVLLACGWQKTGTGYFLEQLSWWPGVGRGFDDDKFGDHDPTASLDAAETLVPEGWHCDSLRRWDGEQSSCRLVASRRECGQWVRHANDGEAESRALTPALALTAAALRARAAQ